MANAYEQGISQSYQQAFQSNQKRLSDIMNIYDKVAGFFSPGGDFGKGYQAILEATKESDIARGTQALVSSGLYNTTKRAGLGQQWEKEVGTPARLSAYDTAMGRYTDTLMQKAGAIERVEDVYPNVQMATGNVRRAAAPPRSSSGGYGSTSSRWASHPIMGTAATASRAAWSARTGSSGRGLISLKGGGTGRGRNQYMG
ncbi:MAG: hypothetical protein ACXABY_02790 [Candidatus Thorarchaeota archaeon]|jgi:hypothetical protein